MILKLRSWVAAGWKDGLYTLAGGPILEDAGGPRTTEEEVRAKSAVYFDSITHFSFGNYLETILDVEDFVVVPFADQELPVAE